VITGGEKKYGLIVDALEGEEELVIKALDDRHFFFSTDLGNGAFRSWEMGKWCYPDLLAVVDTYRDPALGMRDSAALEFY